MITKQQLRGAIRSLGLSGRDVWANTSLRSFGEHLEDGADGLIDAFLEEGCTLMVPSFNWSKQVRPKDVSYPARNAVDDVTEFNDRPFSRDLVFRSDSCEIDRDLGALPVCLAAREGRVRGNHAIAAFAAVGPDAQILLSGQDNEHPYAPFEVLCERGGAALLIGVTLKNETMIHLAECMAGRNMLVRWVYREDGSIAPVTVSSCSHGYSNFDETVAPFEKRLLVGSSLWRCFDGRTLVETCAEAVCRNPEITRCENPGCTWCRDMIPGGPVF